MTPANLQDVTIRLQDTFSSLLHTDPSEISTSESLFEIGVDSLILVEAIRRIEKDFSVKLTIRQLFEEITSIDEISDYIATKLPNVTSEKKKETLSVDLLSTLVDILSHLLQIPSHEIPTDETLLELGADSLILVEFIRRIEKEVGVKLTIRQLFEELTTLNEIKTHLKSQGAVVQSTMNSTEPSKEHIEEDKQPLNNLQKVVQLHSHKPVQQKEDHWQLHNDPNVLSLTTKQENYLSLFVHDYLDKTPKSRELSKKYNKYLCHGRRSFAVMREQTLPLFYTIHAKESAGATFTDIDSNEYVDIAMGFGCHLFGHSPSFLVKALTKQLKLGVQLGPEHPDTGEVASLMNELTGCDRFTFCNTGTESIMTAIRIARAATKRRKIVIFKNSYHGHFDSTLVVPDMEKGYGYAKPMALGSPSTMAEDVIVLDYAKNSAIDYIRNHGNDIAVVIIEPVQNRRPDLHPKEFLQKLRAATLETNTILLFDEILVGFRIAQGGAQKWAGVKADMVTYGKCIGGGLPISVIGGTEEIMSFVDGGIENIPYNQRTETTYTAGTYVKNPLAIAAMKALLLEMKKRGPSIQEDINKKTQQLVEQLTNVFIRNNVPLEIKSFGSFFRFSQAGNLSFVYRPIELDLFSYHMIHNGIYLWEGGTCFLSDAHTQEHIDKIVSAAELSVKQLLAGGFFNSTNNK